jgi:hypothetical protein
MNYRSDGKGLHEGDKVDPLKRMPSQWRNIPTKIVQRNARAMLDQILPMKLAFCAFPFLRYFPFSFSKSEVTRGRVMILRKFSASQKQKRFRNNKDIVFLLAQPARDQH